MFFSDFLPEIKKKVLKNSVLSYSLELVDKQTLVDSLVENGQKSVSTSFLVCTALETWSKYTTVL